MMSPAVLATEQVHAPLEISWYHWLCCIPDKQLHSSLECSWCQWLCCLMNSYMLLSGAHDACICNMCWRNLCWRSYPVSVQSVAASCPLT